MTPGVLAVISTLIKQRRDSVEQFRQWQPPRPRRQGGAGNRHPPALPARAAVTAAELQALVKGAVAEAGAKGPKDMGAVMKALMPKVQGRAEGKAVSDAVKAALATLG